MKVLISYSGSYSMAVAEELHKLIRLTLPNVEPWTASVDIPPGERWESYLSRTLEEAKFAIVCVTRDNTKSEWLHFEAGAIAGQIGRGRVMPLAIDFAWEELGGPIAQFLGINCDENGLRRILKSLNESMSPRPVPQLDLDAKLRDYWPNFRESTAGGWISWDEYWGQQAKIVKALRSECGREGGYDPDLLVGISNGGLQFADTVQRRVYNNKKPLLCLWAKRDQRDRYFDNVVNNSAFGGKLIEKLVEAKGGDDKIQILVLDDVVGTTATFRQAIAYLRRAMDRASAQYEVRFAFLYTNADEIPEDVSSYLLQEDPRCKPSLESGGFDPTTGRRKLPYLKDVGSGGVIDED